MLERSCRYPWRSETWRRHGCFSFKLVLSWNCFLRDFQMSGCVWGVGAMGLDLKGLLEQIDFTPLHVSTEKCSRYGCLIQKERSHDLYTGKIDTWRIMPDGKTYKSIYCHSKGYEAQKNLWFSWFNSLGSQCSFPPALMISKLSVPPSRSPAVPVRNLRKWGSPKAPNVQPRNSIQQENVRVQIYVWLYFVSLDLRFVSASGGVWSLKLRPSADRLGNRLEKDWQREQGNANDFAKATFLTLQSLMHKVKFLFNPCHSSFAVFPAECLRPGDFTLCWCLSWKLRPVKL